MMSFATSVRSTQPGPFDAFFGHGPHRSTLFWLMPISTESWSKAHTPGALPSRPPELTRMTLALLVDRKSTRLNSSHVAISYAVFCLKKKKKTSYPLSLKKKKQERKTQTK